MPAQKTRPRAVQDKGPPTHIMDGTPDSLRPAALLFDPGNLRLLERTTRQLQDSPAKLIGQRALQDKLFSILVNDELFGVEELAASIIHNGFLRHEQLIVAPYDGESFVVLEGNRRLCAVQKILRDKDLLKSLSSEIRESLSTLP